MSILDFLCPCLTLNAQNMPLCVNFNRINCLAFVGGGGKSTLMAYLSQILPTHGFGVVSSTTTRMFAPKTMLTPLRSDAVLLAEGKETAALTHELAAFFHANPCGHITLGLHIDSAQKLHGLDPVLLCQTMTGLNDFRQSSLPLFWLIEADGSAGLPLKAHAPHEPVIPALASEIILMAGLDALGLPLKDAVHRPELAVSRLCASSLFSLITPQMFAHQILSEIPLFSTSPAPFTVLLNKEDLLKSTESAELIANTLHLPHPTLPCYAGSLQQNTLRCL